MTAPFQSVELKDSHPLHGGQLLDIRGDGRLYAQVVFWDRDKRAFQVKRYQTVLPPTAIKELADLVDKHSFFSLAIPERAGIPEESHPTITVIRDANNSRSVSKWGNDKQADFDAIYGALLDLIRKAQATPPSFTGPYDSRWKPTPGTDDLPGGNRR